VETEAMTDTRIYCNACRRRTVHTLKFTHHALDGDPAEDQYFEEWTDSLWVCCGCETATLVHRWKMAGAEGKEDAPQPEVDIYPPRSDGTVQPKYFVKLPSKLTKLYRETAEAFNSDCMMLCTIGLRALIDGVCKDKGIEAENMEKRIDGLLKFIPNQTLIDSLHGFRFAGNDAAHDLEAMYPTDAAHAIEVMEDLLNFLYDFDYKAASVKDASKRAKIRGERTKSRTNRVQ
jgi:hypothetical protein